MKKFKFKKEVTFRLWRSHRCVVITKEYYMFLALLERYGLSVSPHRKYADIYIHGDTEDEVEAIIDMRDKSRLEWIEFFGL